MKFFKSIFEFYNDSDFVARKSDHIKDDIKRGWSSWNFGEEGFKGTKNQLDKYLDSITDEMPAFISGFEIYPKDIKDFEFGELYKNYWVAIDNVNASGGLSGIQLKSDNLEDAKKEILKRDYSGDGISFDPNDYDLVYSFKDLHIFKIKE